MFIALVRPWRPFKGIGFVKFKKVLLNPWALIFIINCKFYSKPVRVD